MHMQIDAHRSLLCSFESSSAIVAFLPSSAFFCGVQNSLPFSCTILATLSARSKENISLSFSATRVQDCVYWALLLIAIRWHI